MQSGPSRRFWALVLLYLGLVLAAPAAGAEQGAGPREFEQWWKRAQRAAPQRRADEQQRLRELLEKLPAQGEPAQVHASLLSLLGEMARAQRSEPAATWLSECVVLVRGYLRDKLQTEQDEQLARWLAAEYLGSPERHPQEERQEALLLLSGSRSSSCLLGLLSVASNPRDPLLQAAEQALLGWPDPAVHGHFLQRLAADREALGPSPASLACLRHLRLCGAVLDSYSLREIHRQAAARLCSPAWRWSLLGIGLASVLDPAERALLLVEGLRVWNLRSAEEQSSLRAELALAEALEQLTGRSFGRHAERWLVGLADWDPKAPTAAGAAAGASPSSALEGPSRATFYGLYPRSERILFVLDRSGSMAEKLSSDRETRWEEAVDQLVRCLKSAGERTRFGLLVFNDELASWHPQLVPATSARIQSAREWLLGIQPRGGTLLAPALQSVLPLRPDGSVQLEAVFADTVVILCDGLTEGPGWVRPWLAGPNAQGQLRVHALRIGPVGDGTLEALAEGTGGQFLEILGY